MVCGALMQMIVVRVVLASLLVVKYAFLVAVGATWESGVAVSYNIVFYQGFRIVSDLAITLLRPTRVTRGATVRSRATRPYRRASAYDVCTLFACVMG